MTPETRQAIEQQCRYIKDDQSIAYYVRAMHDSRITFADVASVRAKLKEIRPQGRPAPSYGVQGPVIGPSEREFVVKADLRTRSEALHFATMKMFDRLARKHGLTREHVGLHVLYGPDAFAKWRAAQ